MKKDEDRIQQEMVVWFRNNYCLNHHKPKCKIFSVPNEVHNYRKTERIIEIKKKKQIGMEQGASDFIVVIPNKVVFFETKTLTGTQSPAQIEWQKTVKLLGFDYHVVRTLEDFKKIIDFYFGSDK